MSVPMMRGDRIIAHMEKWSLFSSSFMPPFPTSNMSMSFQAPDWLLLWMAAILFRMFMIEQWNPGRAQLYPSSPEQGQRSSGRSKES